MKIGFIGTGNMAARWRGPQRRAATRCCLPTAPLPRPRRLQRELGGTVCPNAEAAETAELLFLGVKPQGLPGLQESWLPCCRRGKGNAPVVVSMATAVTLGAGRHARRGTAAHPHHAEHAPQPSARARFSMPRRT